MSLISPQITSARKSINLAHAFSGNLPSKNSSPFVFYKFIRSGKSDKGLSFRAMVKGCNNQSMIIFISSWSIKCAIVEACPFCPD